jgi:hypothetical protein
VRALLGPRFGVEATFIIAVAAFAGLLELPLRAILAAVFGSWALVAVAEIVASRRAASRPVADGERGVAPVPPAPLSVRAQPEPDRVEPLKVELEFEPEPPPTVAEVEELVASAPDEEPVAATPERPQLAAVPEPAPAPPPEPEPEAPAEPAVVSIRPSVPREWNVWDLERRLQAQAGGSIAGEELSYVLMYLREYASPDGVLPVEFDALVRESFGDLVEGEV